MNINSQFSFYPPQPDNPSDSERNYLLNYALAQKGWLEDISMISRLLSPPPEITNLANPGEFKKLKVGILGGGLAGLAAAYELRKLGFDITIYDALDDRVGGRIYTYYFDKQKKLYHEFGPMRIPVSHETVWHYIKLFNLPTRPFIQNNSNGYAYLRGSRARIEPDGYDVMKKIYPRYNLYDWEKGTSWQNILSIGTDNHLLNARQQDRAEILQVKQFYSYLTQIWSKNSNMDMMTSSGISQEALNLVSNFLPLLYGNLYNSFIDYIQESYPANLNYLYEIPGGMQRLPEAFYNSFKETKTYEGIAPESLGKVQYKAGCWVNGIYLDDNGKKIRINYQHLKTKNKITDVYDYVVCSIPFSTLRNVDIDPLFSPVKMRAIREVNYTPAHKSLLLCRKRFWEKAGIVGGPSITDLPIGSIWYPSDHAKYINNPYDYVNQLKRLPWNEPGVIIGSFNFNLDTTRLTNQPEEKILTEIKREIEMVHGLPENYLDDIVAGYKTVNWSQEPSFRGAISFFAPEQKKLFSYGMALPEYNGRIFFAGEHISAVHRWMQGALQTGMTAANELASKAVSQS